MHLGEREGQCLSLAGSTTTLSSNALLLPFPYLLRRCRRLRASGLGRELEPRGYPARRGLASHGFNGEKKERC